MEIREWIWGYIENKTVYIIEFHDEYGLLARVSNFGCILQTLMVTGEDGKNTDVVLGYDTVDEYREFRAYFGSLIGPIADRLANARCELNGRTIQFDRNAGPDCMHSGSKGFHNYIWDYSLLNDGIRFERIFGQRDTGFPGEMTVTVIYRFERNRWKTQYTAKCDRETALSITNHSYFSLSGGCGTCADAVLRSDADLYAETTREREPICTGRTIPVEGTVYDFRKGRKISDALSDSDFHEIRTAGGIDHYFIVPGKGIRNMATVEQNGIRLTCRSDAPGLLIYTANGLDNEKGKCGRIYRRNAAICFETEQFPNAVNFPEYRGSVLLRPGETYTANTEFIFESIPMEESE